MVLSAGRRRGDEERGVGRGYFVLPGSEYVDMVWGSACSVKYDFFGGGNVYSTPDDGASDITADDTPDDGATDAPELLALLLLPILLLVRVIMVLFIDEVTAFCALRKSGHCLVYCSPVPKISGAVSATPLGAAKHKTIIDKLGAFSGFCSHPPSKVFTVRNAYSRFRQLKKSPGAASEQRGKSWFTLSAHTFHSSEALPKSDMICA